MASRVAALALLGMAAAALAAPVGEGLAAERCGRLAGQVSARVEPARAALIDGLKSRPGSMTRREFDAVTELVRGLEPGSWAYIGPYGDVRMQSDTTISPCPDEETPPPAPTPEILRAVRTLRAAAEPEFSGGCRLAVPLADESRAWGALAFSILGERRASLVSLKK